MQLKRDTIRDRKKLTIEEHENESYKHYQDEIQ
jgi:hypothetical protein